jgi:2-polyprenyl-6-methoxyphenol hydroxylase-like FAD-dependent oxidoreductase
VDRSDGLSHPWVGILAHAVQQLRPGQPAVLESRHYDTTSQIHLDTWSTGRVALIGDAGYAAGPGGNGTGNAVVAAYVLAGELAAASGDHATAFARYEQRLRGYIAGGQQQAAGGEAFLAPSTWNKIRQRNRFFKILPYLPVSPLIRRAATKTATNIVLPDYAPAVPP